MKIRLLTTVCSVAVAGAFAIVGCGSGDDSSPGGAGNGGGGASGGNHSGGATTGGKGGTTAGGTGGATAGGTTAGGSGGATGGKGGTTAGGSGGATGGKGGATAGGTGGALGMAGDMGVAGEAGATSNNCTVLPNVLFDFDAAGSSAGWAVYGDAGDTVLNAGVAVTQSPTVGRSCAGALAVTMPFTIYSANETADIYFLYGNPGSTAYSGKTTLHMWVKLDVGGANPAFLRALQTHIKTSNYTVEPPFGPFDTNAATYADGQWHEQTFDLRSASATLTDMSQISLKVYVPMAAPVGGPAAPSTVTMYIDDIYAD